MPYADSLKCSLSFLKQNQNLVAASSKDLENINNSLKQVTNFSSEIPALVIAGIFKNYINLKDSLSANLMTWLNYWT